MVTTARRCLLGLVCAVVGASPSHAAGTPGAGREDAAMTAFVRHYESAVNRRAVDTVNACLNTDVLVERACEGLGVTAEVRRGFAEGVHAGLDWGQALATGLGEDGHYRLLRLHRVGGSPRAMLRLVNGRGGLNYHDLVLGDRADGGFEIVDVYVYLSGEMMSETIRRSLRQVSAAMEGKDAVHLEALALVEQLAQLAQEGECAAALDTYGRLPASAQEDKAVMILRVTCAAQLDAPTLERACRDFRRLYPDDTCIDLLTVDQFIVREEWTASLAAFERIQRSVGEDAYLDALVANVHRQRGDFGLARATARRAMEREPDLDDGYWALLELALAERRHDETIRLLEALETRFGWTFDRLEAVEAYAEFVRSPAYARWVATRHVSSAD